MSELAATSTEFANLVSNCMQGLTPRRSLCRCSFFVAAGVFAIVQPAPARTVAPRTTPADTPPADVNVGKNFTTGKLGSGLAVAASTAVSAGGAEAKWRPGTDESDLDLGAMARPVPLSAIFQDPGYHIWCSTMIQGDDGKCHLYYSRWPRHLTQKAWVTHSEVAHAVADHAFGVFKPVDVALPARGPEYWDGMTTHNPSVIRARDGKYYLYYMGTRGDGIVQQPLNWTHRNNQRIGVAVADSPYGPWQRLDRPVLDVSADPDAPDALVANNPAVAQRPDGGFLMMYKAVAKKKPLPAGGPVTFLMASGDGPFGPFKKELKPMFGHDTLGVAAEDPFIWYGRDRYWAVVRVEGEPVQKDGTVIYDRKGASLVLYQSMDGFDWTPARHVLVANLNLKWEVPRPEPMIAIQRPQVYFENGVPVAVLCVMTAFWDVRDGAYSVRIPLR